MPSKSNFVCATCHVEMRCAKVGAIVEELMDDGAPYKVWSCDLYQCPECVAIVAGDFPPRPMAEHFDPTYQHYAAMADFSFGAKVTA